MNIAVPVEHQAVEVLVGDDVWQAATYKEGEFVDAYGLPLDKTSIVKWRAAATPAPANGSATAAAKSA